MQSSTSILASQRCASSLARRVRLECPNAPLKCTIDTSVSSLASKARLSKTLPAKRAQKSSSLRSLRVQVLVTTTESVLSSSSVNMIIARKLRAESWSSLSCTRRDRRIRNERSIPQATLLGLPLATSAARTSRLEEETKTGIDQARVVAQQALDKTPLSISKDLEGTNLTCTVVTPTEILTGWVTAVVAAANNHSSRVHDTKAVVAEVASNPIKEANNLAALAEGIPMVAMVREEEAEVVVEPLRQRVRSETRPSCRARRGIRRTMRVPPSSTCSRCSSRRSRPSSNHNTRRQTTRTTMRSIMDSRGWRRTQQEDREVTLISSTMQQLRRQEPRATQVLQQASMVITIASNTTNSTTDNSSSNSRSHNSSMVEDSSRMQGVVSSKTWLGSRTRPMEEVLHSQTRKIKTETLRNRTHERRPEREKVSAR